MQNCIGVVYDEIFRNPKTFEKLCSNYCIRAELSILIFALPTSLKLLALMVLHLNALYSCFSDLSGQGHGSTFTLNHAIVKVAILHYTESLVLFVSLRTVSAVLKLEL